MITAEEYKDLKITSGAGNSPENLPTRVRGTIDAAGEYCLGKMQPSGTQSQAAQCPPGQMCIGEVRAPRARDPFHARGLY